jgi:hypothetical protein
MSTRAVPLAIMPSSAAAASDRSIRRPFTKGPRSFIRTTTRAPFPRFVTRRRLPKGRERWAAVKAKRSKISPEAVLRPWKGRPYQDAVPSAGRAVEGAGDGAAAAEAARNARKAS